MKHFASPKFWVCYKSLPKDVRDLADKNFELLKTNPKYPSLHFKQIGNLWLVRVGKHYRALSLDKTETEGIVWFWIGSHADYDKLVK
jgi:mRNA-degrading endonuclease RelE of RelBE toxin-antitoxin system